VDLYKTFDYSSSSKLFNIIEKDLRCKKTIFLLRNLIKSGHIKGIGDLNRSLIEASSKRNTLPLLLRNILINDFDIFILEIKQKYKISNVPDIS
jgi:hypothetical protein